MTDIELGGNIHLAGFSELEPAKLIVVKKMVGNFVRKLDSTNNEVRHLGLVIKDVHKHEHGQKYEIHGKLQLGDQMTRAEITDHNLFFGLNKVLKKLS